MKTVKKEDLGQGMKFQLRRPVERKVNDVIMTFDEGLLVTISETYPNEQYPFVEVKTEGNIPFTVVPEYELAPLPFQVLVAA